MLYFTDVDASGKPGSGILTGNNRWFGSYSQCKKQQNSRYCLSSFSAIISLEADKHQASERTKTSKFDARTVYNHLMNNKNIIFIQGKPLQC